MRNRRNRRGAGLVALALAAGLAPLLTPGSTPAASASDDPIFVEWSTVLPSLGEPLDPDSPNDCRAGRPQCVDVIVREMDRRLDDLAAACHHDAVFGLAYLRTTEEFRRTIQDPEFFDDTRYVTAEDAVFARLYFEAYDAWSRGEIADVPPAWRVAFDAAAQRRVSGSGNLLLGMSAHVNRDLPFTLAALGLRASDGSSRKPDHDRVNIFLNRVVDPLIAEEAARFDPTMDDAATPYGLTWTALMQLLVSWRETAWRNAERLASAPDVRTRAQVAQDIETYAATVAEGIVAASAYTPPVTTSAARDAYCSVNHG